MVTLEQMEKANADWGANCGPGALATVIQISLDDVRPHMGDFEQKRYTNPTMMNNALRSIGRPWRKIGAQWPKWGLARIQWEGPWTQPGVPMAARYRHTHWVVSAISETTHGIFDINALGNGSGWCSLEDWSDEIVPWILRHCVPRANGQWHITHAIEVERPS